VLKIAGIVGKILLGLLVLLVVAGIGIYAAAMAKYHRKWTAHDATFPIPFPRPGEAVADSAARAEAIARGEKLIASRTPCSDCHGKDFGGSVVIGKTPVEAALVGYWAAPNLTSGRGSVTKGFTAHDWDLAVRHGIRHTGQTSSMPAMEFTTLSDHELSDIVTAIEARPPVDRDLGKVRLGLVFSLVVLTDKNAITAQNVNHQAAHPVEAPGTENPLALGAHIAQVCSGCHGPNYSGGKVNGDPNMPIVANLTRDPSGVKGWSEGDFLRAMHEGVKPDGTRLKDAMPWRVYGKMSDVELRAVWAFLQTLPPTPKGVRP
jgi:mono/diheme cytochrome c family protein